MDSGDVVEGPVEVFYLVTEPHRNGHRWLIRQYGKPFPVLTGNDMFMSEDGARKAGKAGLIAASARAKATRHTSRQRQPTPEVASEWIG